MKKILKYLFILFVLTVLTGFILYSNADSLFVYSVENGSVLAMKLALQFKVDLKTLFMGSEKDFIDKLSSDVKLFELVIKYTKQDIEKYAVMRYALDMNSKELVQCVLNEFDFTDYKKEYSFLDDDIIKARDPEIFKLLNSQKFNLSNVILKKMMLKEYSDVREVFESNGLYDIKTKSGLTPLMCAVINRDHDLFDYLIGKKADVNASYNDGDTPLFMAIRNKPDFKIIKTLIENGAKINIKNIFLEMPLELLVENPGNEEIIKYLIDKGADDDGKINAYSSAMRLNRQEYVRMIRESELPANAIDIAVQGKNDGWPGIDSALKNGADINEKPKKYSKIDYVESVKKIARSIGDPDKKSKLLNSISLNGDDKYEYFLKYLIEQETDITVIDSNKNPVFIRTVYFLKHLIEQGADITITDSDENTLLMKTVDSNNDENFMLLIDCGIDVNARNKSGETALIRLIKNRRGIRFFKTILNAGADVNIKDANMKDVFYYIYNHDNNKYYPDLFDILKLLLSYKVPVSRELFKKREAIGYNKMTFAELERKFEDAVENNSLESAEIYLGSYLYNENLDSNINNLNKKIIKSNNLDLIKIYVKGIETYNSNYMINGIITEALTQRRELSILKYLLDSLKSIDESVIRETVAESNIEALKLLLSAENIKKIENSELFNIALMNAIGLKNTEAVKILSGVISEDEMDSDCRSYDINRFNNRSFTSFSLVMSIIGGNDEIARILLEKKNNVNKRYRYDFTALAYASWYGRDELIKILLSKGADPDLGTSDGTTPLMYASMAGNTGAIELLIKNGADVNAKNNNGINALCEAITSDRTEAVELLKAKGADLKDAERILEKIKRAGTNINSKDSRGNTMLMKAAYEKNYLKAKLLIDRGAKINDDYSKAEHNILRAAIIYADRYGTFPYELFKLLVDKGADPYCENNEQAFANMMSVSIISKYDNMIDLLKNKSDSLDISKMSNLIEAAISAGSIEWLSQLIDKGVDINSCVIPHNQNYRIPLFFTAVDNCDYQILEVLLKKGVDINARAIKKTDNTGKLTVKICDSINFYLSGFKEYGGNALFFINNNTYDISKFDNCFKILEMLVKAGCDINGRNDYGYTPIFAGSINMDSSFIKSMIALGADVNVHSTDDLKLTPIFAACINKNNPEVLNVLIDNGAEVNQVAQDMWTPLMFAVRARNARAVEILIGRGAKINEANADGMTALDICYTPDDTNKKILKILRSAGAVSGHKKYVCETVFN